MQAGRILKYIAVVLTILLVFGMYPAILWGWIAKTNFWLLYVILIALDLICIRLIKRSNEKKYNEKK